MADAHITVEIRGDKAHFEQTMAGVERDLKNTQQRFAAAADAMAAKAKFAFAGMATAIVGATKVFADFDRSMAKVSTMLRGDAMMHMDNYRRAVRDMSIEFAEGTDTLADGLYQILSASIEADEALEVLEVSARSAAAGMTTTARAADVITTALNAYKLEASEASRVSGALFNAVALGKTTFEELSGTMGRVIGIASMAGVELEEVLSVITVLTRQGIDTAEAVTGLRAAITELIDPSDQARTIAAELGFQLDENTLRTEGLTGITQMLTGATEAQLRAMFPNIRAFTTMAGAVSGVEAVMQDYKTIVTETGADLEAFEKMSESATFTIDQMVESVKVLVGEFGEALWPMVEEVIGQIREWINWLRDLDEEQKRAFGEMFFNITKIVGLVAGMHMVQKAIMGIAAAMSFATAAMAPWAMAIQGVILAIYTLDMYKDRIIPFMEGMAQAIGLVSEEMTQFHAATVDMMPEVAEHVRRGEEVLRDIQSLEEEISRRLEQRPELTREFFAGDLHQLEALEKELDNVRTALREFGVLHLHPEFLPEYEEYLEMTEEHVETQEELRRRLEETLDLPPVPDVPPVEIPDVAIPEVEDFLMLLRQIHDQGNMAADALKRMEDAARYDAMITQLSGLEQEMMKLAYGAKMSFAAVDDSAERSIAAIQRLAEEHPALAKAAEGEIARIRREQEETTLTVRMQHLVKWREIWKSHLEEERRERERSAEEIERIEQQKHDVLQGLEYDYLRMTGEVLELTVRQWQDKYEEITDSFRWSTEEMQRVNKIAMTDLTQQLKAYVDTFVREMERTGASQEEVNLAFEEMVQKLIELEVGYEIIDQLKNRFDDLKLSIDDAVVSTDDLISGLLGVMDQAGRMAIDMRFGIQPGPAQIGGIFGGLLGMIPGIPPFVGQFAQMIFGWAEQWQRRMQEIIDSVAQSIEPAFRAAFEEADWIDATCAFWETLHDVIVGTVIDAMIEAFLLSEVMQDVMKDFGLGMSDAMREAMKGGVFDPRVFADMSQPVIDDFINYFESGGMDALQAIWEQGRQVANWIEARIGGISIPGIEQSTAAAANNCQIITSSTQQAQSSWQQAVSGAGSLVSLWGALSQHTQQTPATVADVCGRVEETARVARTTTTSVRREVERIADEVRDIQRSMESAMKAAFAERTWEEGLKVLRRTLYEGIYSAVLESVTAGFLAATAVEGPIKALGEALNRASTAALRDGVFDVDKFTSIFEPALESFEKWFEESGISAIETMYEYLRRLFEDFDLFPDLTGEIRYVGVPHTGVVHVPAYQSGGYVPRTGLAMLHEGEYVLPRDEAGMNITQNFYSPKPIDERRARQETEKSMRLLSLELGLV